MDSHANAAGMATALANLRAELAPAADDPRAVLEQCETCPSTFWRWKGRRRHWCPNCAAGRMVAGADAISSRSGEAYDRNVRAQLAHWNAEAQRLGLFD